jgi:hypothetical protein
MNKRSMVAAVLLLLSGSTAVLHVSVLLFFTAILFLLPWKKLLTLTAFQTRQR